MAIGREALAIERRLELALEDLEREKKENMELRAALRSIKAIAVERVGK